MNLSYTGGLQLMWAVRTVVTIVSREIKIFSCIIITNAIIVAAYVCLPCRLLCYQLNGE